MKYYKIVDTTEKVVVYEKETLANGQEIEFTPELKLVKGELVEISEEEISKAEKPLKNPALPVQVFGRIKYWTGAGHCPKRDEELLKKSSSAYDSYFPGEEEEAPEKIFAASFENPEKAEKWVEEVYDASYIYYDRQGELYKLYLAELHEAAE